MRKLLQKIPSISDKLKRIDQKFLIKERIFPNIPPNSYLWLHGASLGECKMLLFLAKSLQQEIPHCPRILLTTQKAEVKKFLEQEKNITIAIAPLDLSFSLKNFILKTKPIALILGENELWKGYLDQMKEISLTPSVALISGRFYKGNPFNHYSSLGFVAMQTEGDKKRFLKYSHKTFKKNIIVGGDWKLLEYAKQKGNLTEAPAKVEKQFDLTFISVHFLEWPSIKKIILSSLKRNKCIGIVPRKLSEVPLFCKALKKLAIPITFFPKTSKEEICIVNSFGRTNEILKISRKAIIGGSFHWRVGVHNFWESLLLEIPTYIGPYFKGKEEMVQSLIQKQILIPINPNEDIWNKKALSPIDIQNFIAQEREKILNSYSLFLNYLKKTLELQSL